MQQSNASPGISLDSQGAKSDVHITVEARPEPDLASSSVLHDLPPSRPVSPIIEDHEAEAVDESTASVSDAEADEPHHAPPDLHAPDPPPSLNRSQTATPRPPNGHETENHIDAPSSLDPQAVAIPAASLAIEGHVDAESSPEPQAEAVPIGSRAVDLPCKVTTIELVSISATSSAFAETFGLSISNRGRWIVAYTSAALYLLLGEALPSYKDTCRAFRLRRKPLAVAVTDVGKFAILTSSSKIDVYSCGDGSGPSISEPIKKMQTVVLQNQAKSISFSANGDLMVATCDTAVELVTLDLPSGSASRQINCGSAEMVGFSDDGKSLLVTALARKSRYSTFITVTGSFEQPFEGDDDADQPPTGRLWISQLLFPEKVDARQGVFLPEAAESHTSHLLAFNPQTERYGVYDTSAKAFTGNVLDLPKDLKWTESERYDDTLPEVSSTGSVATGILLKDRTEIWTYKVPPEWMEEEPPSPSAPGASDGISPDRRLYIPKRDNNHMPESIHSLRWIQSADSSDERLAVILNTSNWTLPEEGVPEVPPAASGKLMIFDLQSPPSPEGLEKATVDLDEFVLSEYLGDDDLELEREVDIVRRRTQVQRQQEANSVIRTPNSTGMRRAMTGVARVVGPHSPLDPNLPRFPAHLRPMSVNGNGEVQPAIAVDEPYSNSAPRSQYTLHRAATVAQNSPAARMHLRSQPTRPLDYRRADGLREIPHESDADDWVPPPPPYSERPDPPGPHAVSLPITAIPGMAAAVLQGAHIPASRPQPGSSRMRARVSQVVPPVQVPILAPQQPVATRAIPPNGPRLAIGLPGSRFQVADMSPVRSERIIPRRPVATDAQQQQRASQFRPPAPASPPTLVLDTSAAAPFPGQLMSTSTFPGTRSSRGSVSHLSTPPGPSTSASAPTTPVNQSQDGRSGSARFSRTVSNDTQSATVLAIPSVDFAAAAERHRQQQPPRQQSAGESRPVTSLELMRPLPSLPPESTDSPTAAGVGYGGASPSGESDRHRRAGRRHSGTAVNGQGPHADLATPGSFDPNAPRPDSPSYGVGGPDDKQKCVVQ
jgi:hypothetical protein